MDLFNRSALRKALAEIAGDTTYNKFGNFVSDERLAKLALKAHSDLELQRRRQQRRAQSAMRNWHAGIPFARRPLYPEIPFNRDPES